MNCWQPHILLLPRPCAPLALCSSGQKLETLEQLFVKLSSLVIPVDQRKILFNTPRENLKKKLGAELLAARFLTHHDSLQDLFGQRLWFECVRLLFVFLRLLGRLSLLEPLLDLQLKPCRHCGLLHRGPLQVIWMLQYFLVELLGLELEPVSRTQKHVCHMLVFNASSIISVFWSSNDLWFFTPALSTGRTES